MSEIRICGYRPLSGEIKIQGSKNGVLPMLAASVLQRGTLKFTNVPIIQDVICMVGILESIGCKCQLEGNCLKVDGAEVKDIQIPREYVGKMRSSILVMGALLGREGRAVTWHPGGCSIGSRPVDLHLKAFRQLGARIKEEEGRIEARAKELSGSEISFPFPSVGATENALLAAVLAKGETVILGAAMEPEIMSLCRLLNQMGARIQGIGSPVLRIQGVDELYGTEFNVPGDRIAAGTYLLAAAAAGGRAKLLDAPWEEMQAVVGVLRRLGAKVEPLGAEGSSGAGAAGMEIKMDGRPRPICLSTGPYPGFPTDLQSPLLSVLALAEGVSTVEETVFEARFKTVGELRKMGAGIEVSGRRAIVSGKDHLTGASVRAWALRGGAALVAAALAARGETRISDCIYIERGYEDICRDILCVNGDIRWIGS